jgi:flagellar motor switch protein FliN
MADEPVDENAESTESTEGAAPDSEAAAETPEVAGSEGADEAGTEAAAEASGEAGAEADGEPGEPTLEAEEPAPSDADLAMAAAAGAHAAGPIASPVRPQRPPMHAVAVSFAPVAEAGTKGDTSLDFLFDIPVQVTVRLGETRILNLLQLGQGSVVELDKLAGEPLEVVVNNKLMARGEVVVVNEKFGIRLTDVVTPAERIHSLK